MQEGETYMSQKRKGREKCKITSKIKVFCPYCQGKLEVPMQQAVNGQSILCPHCKQEFKFNN